MYPVLILREEVVCLIILIFLLFASKKYDMGKASHTFHWLEWLAIVHVVFDIITVWTVNHTDTVPYWLNYICHIIFFMSAIVFSMFLLNYVLVLCYPFVSKKALGIVHSAPTLYLFALPFLSLYFLPFNGTYSSWGMAAFIGFGLGCCYFIACLIVILINYKNLPKNVTGVLLPMLLFLILGEAVQILVKEVLFTGAGLTIVTVAFFFSIENPVHVLENKVSTDVMTGVKSRQGFEEDFEALNKKFCADKNNDYIFAYFDINNLHKVNSLHGHSEGDRYIVFIASNLMKCLKSASGIYRMGGDEFLAVYYQTPENEVISELNTAKENCSVPEPGMDYTPGIAAGYAVSSPNSASLSDVMHSADFFMYKDKAFSKSEKAFIKNEVGGTTLNISGLTDKLFDAICASSDRAYPFLCNMDTGVSRISPKWVEYFGLPAEFVADFEETWLPYIHPDDRSVFIEDMRKTVDGEQAFHNCEYRAKNAKGEYVLCSCHGSLYHSSEGDINFFSGTLFNHGIKERADSVTGLWNSSISDDKIQEILSSNSSLIVLKIGINNFNRINMIYGYTSGNVILRKAADDIKTVIGAAGEVFSDDGSDFSILLPNASKEKATALYEEIFKSFASGISIDDLYIPLNISCGAFEIEKEYAGNSSTIQSNLICAMDESLYNNHGHIVFYNDMKGATENSNYGLYKEIHKDAVSYKQYFHMVYQPIAETSTEKIIGAEALLRWNSPEYGEVEPGKFIGFLETDPCFYDLGLFILRESISAARKIKDQFPGFSINVNVTALQLQHDEFINDLLSILDDFQYPAGSLVLELTERCKEMSSSFLREKIEELRNHKIRIAFDDMGTGYSTVDLLMNIPVDEIKLDKDFVNGIDQNFSYRLFVETLMRGTADRKYIVCFEGVETEAMLEYLRHFGTSYSQGYYFSKPVPAEEMCKLLKNSN